MSKQKDLTGLEVGRLKVISYSHTKKGVDYWLCDCSCGNKKVINGNSLRYKKTKSCGCISKERWQNYKENKGGIYPIPPGEIELKGKYNSKKSNVKTYKLSPKQMEKYLEELKTKDVKYIKEDEEREEDGIFRGK